MRTLKTVFMAMAVTLMSSLLLTCQKESNPSAIKDQQVSFSINISHLKSSPTLKSAMDFSLSSAASIILTIQNADGTPTQYTKTVVKIEQMNGHFYTQALALKTGTYKLTYFVLTDSTGNTIFASPLAGSREAQNVNSPLPIGFSISTNASTSVDVEVLSTEALTPEDFGLVTFPIVEIKTFSFLVGVADKESHKLIPAKLTVSTGTYSYVQNLDSIANNVVTVKDSLSQYTLKIEKTGYITYTHTYSIDSLKMFKNAPGNLPLLVELEKENFCDHFIENSPSTDLAANPSGTGFPSPEESSNGWGGGSNKWQIVDGIRGCPGGWACGLAFTGGTIGYVEPCGWRQATINFGKMVTFNKVLVWHHATEHIPNTYKIEYWDGSSWIEVFSTANGHNYLKCPSWSWSTPTENIFPAVTGSKVRFSLNNCDITHGWIYEFEVYNN